MKSLFSHKPFILLVAIVIGSSILLGGIVLVSTVSDEDGSNREFNTFSSCNDLEQYILDNEEDDYFVQPFLSDITFEDGADFVLSEPVTGRGSFGSENREFSETNIQVEGVDESDIVKTDGNFIYSIIDNTAFIIEVVSATEQTVVSEFEIPGNPTELFLDEDTLVVFAESDYVSGYWGGFDDGETGVFIYDVSDRTNPELEREVKLEGTRITTRKIDNFVYVISSNYFYDFNEFSAARDYITQYSDSEKGDDYMQAADCEDISYYGDTVNSIVSVLSVPIDGGDVSSKLILGDASNVYMSRDNLYLATVIREFEGEERDRRGGEFGRDILPSPEPTFRRITDVNTEIYKLEINEGEISFDSSGVVNGTILNQFSMDEHDGYFRIATTANDFDGWNDDSYNNLYVLDGDMDQVGEVENLAPGEQIYSARFIGDRAYMVTFKTVDPLFVIGLEDPENPEVLGELKIPGFSNYLHPYDENHIIGIGKDAEEVSPDFAITQGLKIALFDVTEVENPVVESEVIVGGRGSDSEALNNHKAFLFDREKELMVIPATLFEESSEEDFWWVEEIFDGFLVFDINLNSGISERGRVTYETNNYWYYGSGPRSLYIEDSLFTIKDGILKSSDLMTVELLNELTIFNEE